MRWADLRRGFWAGTAGGVAALAALFAYRFATGTPTLPEALAERMIRLLPYQVFALFLAKLQHLAKPLGFVMAIITSVIGFGLGGALFVRVTRGTRRARPALGLAIAVITWAFLTYGFLPFIEGGILGIPLTIAVPSPVLSMALASAVYASVLVLLAGVPGGQRSDPAGRLRAQGLTSQPGEPGAVPREGGRRASPDAVSRRDALRRSALVLAAAAAGSRCAAWIASGASRVSAAAAQTFALLKGMPEEVTPTGRWSSGTRRSSASATRSAAISSGMPSGRAFGSRTSWRWRRSGRAPGR